MLFAVTSVLFSALLIALASTTPAKPEEKKHDAGKLDDLRPLPEEKDSFETVRRNNKVYIDKTPALVKLLDTGAKSFYFTRPRKFGKTMFLRMVQKFFHGQKELFEKLEIYERGNGADRDSERVRHVNAKENKWLKYPVIYLDFSRPTFCVATEKDFRRALQDELDEIVRSNNVQVKKRGEMGELIGVLSKTLDLPVVVLVDEFDAPIMHAYRTNNSELAKSIVSIIREQFAIIEEHRTEGFIGKMFVTGISRFSLFSEESGAKHVVDVTDDKDFAAAFGFTPKEIEVFDPHLKQLARCKHRTREEILKEVIELYGGYHFDEKAKSSVANPLSVIKCLQDRRYDNYWCKINPTVPYVLEVFIRDKLGVDYFENYRIDREELFRQYDVDVDGEPPFHCFMLYEGYLTIMNYDRKSDVCVLDYPNKEIKEFLTDRLSSFVPSENKFISDLPEWSKQLQQAMRDKKLLAMMNVLKLYGFPVLFTDRSRSTKVDWGVTRRLKSIFDAASIKYKEGNQSAVEDGVEKNVTKVVHLQTLDLPMNYVFEIECEKGVQDAILRLLSFAQNDLTTFEKEINGQDEVYLVGMSFTESGQGELDDWVCVPYRRGQVKFDELQAMSKELEQAIKKIHSTDFQHKLSETT